MFKRSVLMAATCAATLASAEPTAIVPTWVWFDETGDDGELVSELPITKELRVVYSIPLPPLEWGDIIDARTTFEVTNDLGFNVMVGRQLVISESPREASGIELSEAATRNITPDMHHDHIQDFGTMVWNRPGGTFFLNVVAYAGASPQGGAGTAVTLEPDYGRLSVTIFRGIPR